MNDWVTTGGERVKHADVWRKIERCMEKFKAVEDVGLGSMEIL